MAGNSNQSNQSSLETIYDVVGIGNAIVDVISHESENFLQDHDLVKNSMTLIETDGV